MRTGRAVVLSTAVNIGMAVAGAAAGVILARGLGAEDRGHLAAVMAWYAISLVVAEIGQSASLTYWVANRPAERATYVSTARLLMLALSLVVAGLGLLFADVLAAGSDEVALTYRIVFLGCILNAAGAPTMYAMQATSIAVWNVLRAVQPLLYLIVIVVLFATERLTLITAAVAVLVSVGAQLLTATVVGGRYGLRRHAVTKSAVNDLSRYGAAYSSYAVPATLAVQYDRVLLSWSVGAQQLGQYAVAITVAQLSKPFATAIASVVFPRFSSFSGTERARVSTENRTIWVTVAATGAALALVGILGAPLVPLVFGPDFAEAVPLIWLLLPAMLVRGVNDVIAMVLRGRGLPARAAVAQLAVLVAGAIGLAAFVGVWGIGAAPVVLAIAELIGLAVSSSLLWRVRRRAAQLEEKTS
ncbi:hypothetical protein GCM10022202_15330 [Microbacterium marinilacus]|uniref:Lipopolysaccharide biosynthesis protein n=1 Tax=Microbacterium marinilacus TaxID=415209 RepID=A0ABP7BCU4_9MICO